MRSRVERVEPDRLLRVLERKLLALGRPQHPRKREMFKVLELRQARIGW